MINISEDIYSLTDFKKNTNFFVSNLKKTKRPSILTVNGKAQLVVIDANAFQKMVENRELIDSIAQIEQSFKDFDNKKYKTVGKAFKEIKDSLK